jgi:putative heme iron utilization protein
MSRMVKVSRNEGNLARLRRRNRPDWRSAVQAYVAENPEARAIDIAAALGCTEGEALSALSEVVLEIPGVELSQLLAEIRAWGPVLVLVRNADAIAEAEVPGDVGYLNGDWLNWIDEGINLHIRVAATHHILALVRDGKRGSTHSFNLVNQAGEVFCRFYTRTPAARARFLNFCHAYTPKARES